MTAQQSNNPSRTEAVDARLTRRLMRPLQRPGMIPLRRTRHQLNRAAGMVTASPLVEQIQRRVAQEPVEPQDLLPLVYADPRFAPVRANHPDDQGGPVPQDRPAPPLVRVTQTSGEAGVIQRQAMPGAASLAPSQVTAPAAAALPVVRAAPHMGAVARPDLPSYGQAKGPAPQTRATADPDLPTWGPVSQTGAVARPDLATWGPVSQTGAVARPDLPTRRSPPHVGAVARPDLPTRRSGRISGLPHASPAIPHQATPDATDLLPGRLSRSAASPSGPHAVHDVSLPVARPLPMPEPLAPEVPLVVAEPARDNSAQRGRTDIPTVTVQPLSPKAAKSQIMPLVAGPRAAAQPQPHAQSARVPAASVDTQPPQMSATNSIGEPATQGVYAANPAARIDSPAPAAPIDIDTIVERVERRFLRRLAVEDERRGGRR